MALHCLLRDSTFEVITLLTTVTEGYERISMHGVRRELLQRQAASIGLPLEEVRIPPQCPNSIYESRMEKTVLRYRERGVLHVGFGDIFLRDLRAYRESNLARAGNVSRSFHCGMWIRANWRHVSLRMAFAPELFASIQGS